MHVKSTTKVSNLNAVANQHYVTVNNLKEETNCHIA